MSAITAPRPLSLGGPVTVSVILHVAAVGALLFFRSSHAAPSAPMYRVNLVAAPPSDRAIGVVQPPVVAPPTKTPPAPKAASKPVVEKAKVPPLKKTAPVKAVKAATPNTTAAVAKPADVQPTAGGGPTGGKGADVANVRPDGIEFPYPAYLERVVRYIALNFKPSSRGALTAEVSFLIRRDGSIAQLRVTKASPVFAFNQDALAAVELASKSFGPLPEGFNDDVLPVIFSFDPRLIR